MAATCNCQIVNLTSVTHHFLSRSPAHVRHIWTVTKVMRMIFCAAQNCQERIVAVVVDGGGTQGYSLTLLS